MPPAQDPNQSPQPVDGSQPAQQPQIYGPAAYPQQLQPQVNPKPQQPAYYPPAQPGYQPLVQSPGRLKLPIIIAVIVAIIALGGGALAFTNLRNKKSDSQTGSSKTGSNVTTKKLANGYEYKEIEETKTVKAGETAAMKNLSVKLDPVQHLQKVGYVPASPGHELLVTKVTIVNNNSGDLNVSPADFKPASNDGQEYYCSPAESAPDALDILTIKKGSQVTGSIMCEVPTGKVQSIIYKSGFVTEQYTATDLPINYTATFNL